MPRQNLLIPAIHRQARRENDLRASNAFNYYVLRCLHVFALLGVILPSLLAVDYLLPRASHPEEVTGKVSASYMSHYIYTTERYLEVGDAFYHTVEQGDTVWIISSRIFRALTAVVAVRDGVQLRQKVFSVFGWPVALAVASFVLSLLMLRAKPHPSLRNSDMLISIGLLNSLIFLIFFIVIIASLT